MSPALRLSRLLRRLGLRAFGWAVFDLALPREREVRVE